VSRRQTTFDHAAKVVVVAAAIVFVAPIAWLGLTALRQSSELFSFSLFFTPTLDNFGSVLRSYDMGQFFFNSILIASVVMVANVVIGGIAAYGFARFRFPLNTVLFIAILCVKMIPSISLIVPLYLMYASTGLLNTIGAVMITEIAFALPLSVWIMESFFRALPREFEEAAIIDGCSRFEAFVRVVVPLAMPGISVTAIFAFLSSWYSFLVPLVIISSQDKQTLPLALSQMNLLYGIRWDQMSAASIMYIVPTVVIAVIFQKYIVSGLTMGGVKG
jgi:multiple sugar transport system permease protein